MSKKKKILLLGISIIFLLCIITQWDEILIKTKLKMRCFDDYFSDFSLDYVYVKENY